MKSPLLAFCFAKQRQKIHPAHKIYGRDGWRARVAGEPNASFSDWRKGWDSNPRRPCGLTCSPGMPIQPL